MSIEEGFINILTGIITELCGKEQISLDNDLVKDLEMDEVQIIELGVEVEKVFGIEIPNINDGTFKTVNDVYRVIKEEIGEHINND